MHSKPLLFLLLLYSRWFSLLSPSLATFTLSFSHSHSLTVVLSLSPTHHHRYDIFLPSLAVFDATATTSYRFSFSVYPVSYVITGACPSYWPTFTASVSSLSLYHVLLCGAFSVTASSHHHALCLCSLSPPASIYPCELVAAVEGC